MELFSRIPLAAVIILLVALTVARAGIAMLERGREAPDARLRTVGDVLESFIIAVVMVFLVVRPFVLQAFYIPSESMTPTLAQNDRILVNKLCYRLGRPA